MDHDITIKLSTETVRRIAETKHVHHTELPEIIAAVKDSICRTFLIVDDRQGELFEKSN